MYGTPKNPRRRRSRWAPFWRLWHEESTKRGLIWMVSALLSWAVVKIGLSEVPADQLQPVAQLIVDVIVTALDCLIGGMGVAGFMAANRSDE